MLALVTIVLLMFVLTLIVIPSHIFPLKSFLDNQGLLESTISFFSVITGGFIAGLVLTVVNERIQTYSWRRDQALKDIDTIYEPLYRDVSSVARMIELMDRANYPSQVTSWEGIENSYLGTKMKLMEQQLYEDLQRLFNSYPEYATRRENALEMVAAIARKIIEKKLDEKIAKGNLGLKEFVSARKPEEPVRTVKDEILALMPERLNWGLQIYIGLLKGKSIREWSASQSGDEQQYLQDVTTYVNDDGTLYSSHLKFDMKEIESILDELLQEVRDDARIRGILNWLETFNQRAKRLKEKLEDHILQPQLP